MTTEYREERHPFATDNLPPKPPDGVMWVFMKNGYPYSVDFLCPCGCGASCYTPLKTPESVVSHHEHEWEYSQGPNGPTLSPSIRYLGGCNAHFNITDGKAIMHGDSGR